MNPAEKLAVAPVTKEPSNNNLASARGRSSVPGKLLAVTASGPIYAEKSGVVLLPFTVALATLQELAIRSISLDAKVTSSLANRLTGDEAYEAWAKSSGTLSAQLLSLPPQGRIDYLRRLLAYVRTQRNANGLEAVLGSAMNAAWPWIEGDGLKSILSIVSRHMEKSTFARKKAIPVLDVNTRSFSIYPPGTLERVDISEWLDWKAVVTDFGDPGWNTSRGNNRSVDDLLGPGMPGYHGVDLSGLQGPDGQRLPGQGSDWNPNAPGGLLGPGTPGHHGPDTSGFKSPDGRGLPGSQSGDYNPNDPGGLLGPGTPGHHGVDKSAPKGAQNKPGRTGWEGYNPNGPAGLLGPGMPGHHGPDMSNFGPYNNGGPTGSGASLGIGGAHDPYDEMKSTGASAKAFGLGVMGIGAGLAWASMGPVGLAGAPVAGMALIAGYLIFDAGVRIEREGAHGTPSPAGDKGEPPTGGAQPKPAGQGSIDVHKLPDAKPQEQESVPVKKLPDAPPPKPSEPRHSDIYPDPNGEGGGNPTTIWDENGGGGTPNTIWDENGGGGTPTTIWDENGGGGTPTTIWDENGGGGTPTTIGEIVTANVMKGNGLMARLVQIGPSSFAF